MLKITGYSNRISVRPGEQINFMVNCELKKYRADIVRLICGDSSPDGPSYKEELIPTSINGYYEGRRQKIHAGSYGLIESNRHLEEIQSFTIHAMIWPTSPNKGDQCILGKWEDKIKSGFALVVTKDGWLGLTIGNGKGKSCTVSSGKAFLSRHWYQISASWDSKNRIVTLYQKPKHQYVGIDHGGFLQKSINLNCKFHNNAPLTIAAIFSRKQRGKVVCNRFYNGKIDGPKIFDCVLNSQEIESLSKNELPAKLATSTIAAWDFSRDITSIRISDIGARQMHGEIVNLPARGMTGANWKGSEMCWRHSPQEYGAIHFHDDDLYDACWDIDFEFKIPKNLKSGVYAARLRGKGEEEYIPFVIRPSKGEEKRIAFILPTVHYMAYANEHLAFNGPIAEMLTGQVSVMHDSHLFLNEHREYGSSLYDTHSDGSGVCYSSRLRPILNMRPKFQTQWSCFGKEDTNLREFNLDLYFIDWLERFGFEYDVITDEDIHYEGLESIKPEVH